MRTIVASDAVLRRWSVAWAALTVAFALHVLDEAANDFLAWYNPTAVRLQERLGLPFPPVFTFRVWLAGLIAAVLVLAALTPLVRRGQRWLVVTALVYAVIHIGNAGNHLVASALAGRVLPGTLSAPILAAAAGWLLRRTLVVRAAKGASPA